jgi:hypothetical protein
VVVVGLDVAYKNLALVVVLVAGALVISYSAYKCQYIYTGSVEEMLTEILVEVAFSDGRSTKADAYDVGIETISTLTS